MEETMIADYPKKKMEIEYEEAGLWYLKPISEIRAKPNLFFDEPMWKRERSFVSQSSRKRVKTEAKLNGVHSLLPLFPTEVRMVNKDVKDHPLNYIGAGFEELKFAVNDETKSEPKSSKYVSMEEEIEKDELIITAVDELLSWSLRLKVALEISKCLSFLHSAGAQVIHRDFKTSNVLLDSDYNAKLSDFGLAKVGAVGEKSHVSTRFIGTNSYLDPEYLATGHLNVKSDVYSFGVVLLEMLTGRNRPSDEPNFAKQIVAKKRKMQLTTINRSDKNCPREVDLDFERYNCFACPRVEALMGGLYAEVKSSLKISDFKALDEEYKKSDASNNVPFYLNYVAEGIGRDITALSILSDDIIVLPRDLVYAAIDEMHGMQLRDINEDVMHKWGSVFRDAKKMSLDVEFAEEHLKKIAHAYFLSKEPKDDVLNLNAGTYIICAMAEMESFEDGATLSKGILPLATEPTRAPI